MRFFISVLILVSASAVAQLALNTPRLVPSTATANLGLTSVQPNKAWTQVAYLVDVLESVLNYDAARWGGFEADPDSVKDVGRYPDPVLTPGRCDPVRLEDLCSGDVKARRHVTELDRLNVYAEYKLKGPALGQTYEVDHFCPVSLGGSNDIQNLWPQRYSPKPGAREKDVVETWLHREVCAHRMSLDSAQRAIIADWYALYLQHQKEPR